MTLYVYTLSGDKAHIVADPADSRTLCGRFRDTSAYEWTGTSKVCGRCQFIAKKAEAK